MQIHASLLLLQLLGATADVTFSRTVNSFAAGSGKLTFPGSKCSSSDAYGDNDCDLSWGTTVVGKIDGTLTEDTTGSTFHADLKVDGVIPFSFSCPLCDAECSVEVPVIKKSLKIKMPACMKAGPISQEITIKLPPKDPSPVSVSITGKITAKDGSGKVILDADVKADVASAAELKAKLLEAASQTVEAASQTAESLPVAFAWPEVAAPNTVLGLSWSDCGGAGYHVKVDGVSPSAIPLGATTTISGEGDLDADQTGGTFTLTMTGVGGVKLLTDCGGDASKKYSCNIGLGPIKVGTLTYPGLTFPFKAGHITGVPKVELYLPSGIPTFALSTETKLEVKAADGSNMICVDLKTKPQTWSHSWAAERAPF